jgi:peptidoglycan/LPS O-acetylase OafA/YrhL
LEKYFLVNDYNQKEYRYDIQGLRALAILAVVIYHINPRLIPGGFVGVDVFFVISGYLITGILWKSLLNNDFSFLDFYNRRAKRLFPALFVMVFFCFIASYFFLLPSETKDFGRSIPASVFYYSNFYFYSISGYFSNDLKLSPLLHTWSLSVEEQFYIVFPILMFLVYRFFKNSVLSFLLVFLFISLMVSEFLLYHDPSLSFYASPSRFFQFLIGACVAIFDYRKMKNNVGGFWLVLSSVLVLVFCFLFINESTRFPGFSAIAPSLAVATLIYFGINKGLFTYRVLSLEPLVFIGKISYSTYLWHWPIIVFYKMVVSTSPNKYEQFFLLIMSIVIGYLSWRFVENKFRYIDKEAKNISFFLKALSVGGLFSLFGVGLVLANGLDNRFTEQQLYFSSFIEYDSKKQREGECYLSDVEYSFDDFKIDKCIVHKENQDNYLLIGDSHAAHFYNALALTLTNVSISQVNASGCKPVYPYTGEPRCADLIKWAFNDLIISDHFDKIIISARWKSEDLSNLRNTINKISPYTDEVVVLGPIVTYDQALPRLLARSEMKDKEDEFISNARNFDKISKIDNFFKTNLVDESVNYISILDAVCPDSECITLTEAGMPLQWDYGHLTNQGATEVIKKLIYANRL